MSRFTVVWIESAEVELTAIWLTSRDRSAITEAVHSADYELSSRPDSKGGELSEGLNYLDVDPLRVFFVVRAQDRIVEVVGVRQLTPGMESSE